MGSGPSDLAPNERGTSTKQGVCESRHPRQPAGSQRGWDTGAPFSWGLLGRLVRVLGVPPPPYLRSGMCTELRCSQRCVLVSASKNYGAGVGSGAVSGCGIVTPAEPPDPPRQEGQVAAPLG